RGREMLGSGPPGLEGPDGGLEAAGVAGDRFAVDPEGDHELADVGIDVVAGQPEIGDVPAGLAPRGLEVLFGDAHGGGQPGAAGREAEQAEQGIGPRGPVEGGGVGMAGVLVEAVVAGAVEDAVETALETGQAGGVGHGELDVDAALPGPLPGLLDGGLRGVDPGDLVALAGEVDGVLAQPAAHVEDGAAEPPGLLGFDHHRLRGGDVPGNAREIHPLDELPALVQGVEVHVVRVEILREAHRLLLLGRGGSAKTKSVMRPGRSGSGSLVSRAQCCQIRAGPTRARSSRSSGARSRPAAAARRRTSVSTSSRWAMKSRRRATPMSGCRAASSWRARMTWCSRSKVACTVRSSSRKSARGSPVSGSSGTGKRP